MGSIAVMEDVHKRYRTERMETSALAGVSLRIDPGEYLAIVGPSGCGKSTLLSTLGLLEQPDSGTLQLFGRNVLQLPARERATVRNSRLAFVFQSFNLISHLSVVENVELPLVYRGGQARSVIRKSALAVLDRLGLAARADHRPAQLSGGQQQRAAVARAVISQPELILADEPTGNLDSRHGDEVLAMLEELRDTQGCAICMVTHNPEYAARAKRRVHMKDGLIQAES